MSEQEYRNLISEIGDALVPYRYSESERTNEADLTALFVTPRRWRCRYACALAKAPIHVSSVDDCKAFAETIREALAKRYGQFPWFKEVGTYLILLCSTPLYQALLGHESEFKDNTGLHTNVMLGACFVDVETLESSSVATWGLFYSGQHYAAICGAIKEWCGQQREDT
jgi:hypothetical protein